MATRTLKLKTYYAHDANGHCGTVQAKTKKAAEKMIRERVTDGRPLTIKVSPSNCPECGGDNFGIGDSIPVTTGGWHGGKRFTWGRYAGVHLALCTGKRCEDCGHTVEINAHFD